MSKTIRIDFVGPPFAGHLFPLIQMANGLRGRGFDRLHFLCTEQARHVVETEGFTMTTLLPNSSGDVFKISDTDKRVGSNPLFLHRQLRMNLSLMDELQADLNRRWSQDRPDLVIADFTVPVAGLLAKSLSIRWWTSTPTPCVVETGDGVPSYLGGWMPSNRWWAGIRDSLGRSATRLFKRTIHRLFRKQMQALGVDRVYREDGFETIYSPDTILALGVKEFEFPKQWPPALTFVGPLTASPQIEHTPPTFKHGKRHVLVSLGTHLWWAKQNAYQLMLAVAKELPEFEFHFTFGKAISPMKDTMLERNVENVQSFRYLPYDLYADRYDLAINHCGTGVMYRCLGHGLPVLAWPQDYDQFDHTARLVHHGLGLRCRPNKTQMVADIKRLADDQTIRANVRRFQGIIKSYKTIDLIEERLFRAGDSG